MLQRQNANRAITRFVMATTVVGIIAIGIFIKGTFRDVSSDVVNSAAEESTLDFFSDLTKSEVVRVKDGDTYVLMIDGEETTVRLIGVDTPESVAPSDYLKENTSEGEMISEIVKQKIQVGDMLYVEYDVSPTDKYGRTLAYLYFEDGVMVQEWLLENGYAQVMTIQPNSKYAKRFSEVQHIAAENKIGLWTSNF